MKVLGPITPESRSCGSNASGEPARCSAADGSRVERDYHVMNTSRAAQVSPQMDADSNRLQASPLASAPRP
jgi:hypothetical protein